jgi:hypothetical protein
MSLADAILFKPIEIVQKLLEQDSSQINEIDEYGFTPLIEAIIAGRQDVGERLIQQGADIHEPDLTNTTPLHWAVENNHMGFVKLLLENKADPNSYNGANQPVIVKALLRDQHLIKKLLYQYGADLNFGQDYINTKLLGHRFELTDIVDIVDAKGKFIELEFAGFFLEFTLGIIYYSLKQFLNNFAARDYRQYFQYLKPVLDALANANQIVHYQQYLLNYEKYSHQIKLSLNQDPLIIPICYEGHAICFIKCGDWLAKCDRGANSKEEGAVIIYQIHKLNLFTPELIKNLIFKKQNESIIHHQINDYLGLEKIAELPVRAQTIGNCAWANVEATIPTLFFMIMLRDRRFKDHANALSIALSFYDHWQTWDKDIALNECIQSFWLANPARKASKAALLAAILFQTCIKDDAVNQSRARRILQVLTVPEYRYILKAYLKVYQKKHSTAAGKQLVHWLRQADIHLQDFLE